MSNNLTIQTHRELNRVMYVCEKCLDLVVLLGYTKRAFIVSKPIFKMEHECEICKINSADYIIIPIVRGVYICEKCSKALSAASRHRWNNWTKKPVKGKEKCDLCGRPAIYHILPPRLVKSK